MRLAVVITAVVTVACTSGARPAHPWPQPGNDMDAISGIEEVCEVMTRDVLSPAEAREALGRSPAEWVRLAEVVAAEGADEPDLVELALPAPVTRTELEAAFGAGHEAPPLHPDHPLEVLYYPPPRADRRHDCAVLARVDGDETRQVTVRRDPRL